MSLDPLHEWVTRIVFDLPQARDVAIAGGNAMLAYDLVVRPTQDLDSFTPVASEVDPLLAALTQALRGEGARVEVDRRGPGFSRLTVDTIDAAPGRRRNRARRPTACLGSARLRACTPPRRGGCRQDPGPVRARGSTRPGRRFRVDHRYPLQQLCALAEEKDAGFDPRVLADAMSAAAEHPNGAFAELGLSEEATSRLRSKVQEWRAALLAANTENPTRPSSPANPEPPPRPWQPEHDLRSSGHGPEGPSLSL